MQLTYNDTNQDGKVDSITVLWAGILGTDGTYSADALPAWLLAIVGSNNGTYKLEGAPKVPTEMPPSANLPADKTTLDNINSPKYDGSANDGQVTVNTDALRQFSTFLDSLSEPLKTLKIEVDKIAVHPGAFFQAFHLKNAVHTDPSLQTNTSKAIAQTLDAFATIKQGITKLTAEYDSAEELNSASADDLNKVLGRANTIINQMSGTS